MRGVFLKQDFSFLLRVLLVLSLALLVQSCASYGHYAVGMRDGLLQGQPERSLAVAEAKDKQQKEVISSLDKGMLRRINHQYAASNQILETAKQEMEKLHGISVSENLASVTVNETFRGYEGDTYERLLLHAFMAMNYIQLGDLDAARVEMSQADVKMQEWREESRDDAFVRYFAGMIYEALKEPDQALVSYRQAYNVYRDKPDEGYPPVPLNLKKDLLRLTSRLGLDSEYEQYKKAFNLSRADLPASDANTGELIIIVNNGLAPVRQESTIYLFSSEVKQNLRIAFPVYRGQKKVLKQPVITIDDNRQVAVETVEDVDALARHALNEAMPGIMARATARAVVKYNSQHTAENKGSLAGFLMTVTNLVTERADTRSWITLPGEIQLQRLTLPAGEHRVKIEFLNNAGYVVDSFNEEVVIKPRQISFLIKHWIAPVIKNSQKTDNPKTASTQDKDEKVTALSSHLP